MRSRLARSRRVEPDRPALEQVGDAVVHRVLRRAAGGGAAAPGRRRPRPARTSRRAAGRRSAPARSRRTASARAISLASGIRSRAPTRERLAEEVGRAARTSGGRPGGSAVVSALIEFRLLKRKCGSICARERLQLGLARQQLHLQRPLLARAGLVHAEQHVVDRDGEQIQQDADDEEQARPRVAAALGSPGPEARLRERRGPARPPGHQRLLESARRRRAMATAAAAAVRSSGSDPAGRTTTRGRRTRRRRRGGSRQDGGASRGRPPGRASTRGASRPPTGSHAAR